MANIIDYVQWRGDIPLSQVPFGGIDALILSYLSYMPFAGILNSSMQGGGTLLPGQGVHRLPQGAVVDLPGLVGVVGGGGGHCQHRLGVYLHDDAHGTGGNMVLLHRIIQRIFKKMLNT